MNNEQWSHITETKGFSLESVAPHSLRSIKRNLNKFFLITTVKTEPDDD